MLFVGTSIIHPSTEGVFLLCNILDLLIYRFYLISSAVDGNVNAIEKILALYDPYISKCCLRPFYDKYGNVCIVVDMELKGRIRETLIKMILDFDIPLETEE